MSLSPYCAEKQTFSHRNALETTVRIGLWIAAAITGFLAGSGSCTGSILHTAHRQLSFVHSDKSEAFSSDQAVLLQIADPIITAADLSVPIYPGARQQPGALRVRNEKGFAVNAAFLTSMPGPQVISYYRARLAGRVAVLPGPITTTLAVKNSNTDRVMITIVGTRIGTRITIIHTIQPTAK